MSLASYIYTIAKPLFDRRVSCNSLYGCEVYIVCDLTIGTYDLADRRLYLSETNRLTPTRYDYSIQ